VWLAPCDLIASEYSLSRYDDSFHGEVHLRNWLTYSAMRSLGARTSLEIGQTTYNLRHMTLSSQDSLFTTIGIKFPLTIVDIHDGENV